MPAKKLPMDTKTRILVGAIGGISPIIISLLVVDVVALYNETGLMDGIGLGIRCFVLVFIGGLIGYLHQNEEEPFKLFQLGIAAPALLTTAINGNSIATQGFMREHTAESNISFFIKSAHAEQGPFKNVEYFQESKVSDAQLFLRGFLGTKLFSEDDDWYVIIGSHKSLDAAKAQVRITQEKKYLAKIFSPATKSKYYSVVIGANLDLKTAEQLQQNAIASGLPKDSYLWKKK